MIAPIPLTPATRQRVLVKSLYRKLFRESQRIPPQTSLVHLDQWVGDALVKDPETLRAALRSSFRHAISKEGKKEGIPRALEGLKYLMMLDAKALSETQAEQSSESSKQQEDNLYSLDSPISSESLLESVDWLPSISEMEETTEQQMFELPIFPLSGPVFPDEDGEKLPLLSQFSDTPVFGMEVPLRIFEPRYRQLYQDLLSSPDSPRKFVVPFAHPYIPGKFANYGWIYEIVNVDDVADQSNGQFQLVCNHVVTQPIKIAGIANPKDYKTQSTYLRCFANNKQENQKEEEDLRDSPLEEQSSSADDLRPLEDLLHELKSKPLSLSSDNTNRPIDESLIDRLLMASAEGSIWPVAQVWVLNLQTEILRLQVKVSSRIQLQAKAAQQMSASNNLHKDNVAWRDYVTDEMIALAQEPYENHLRCMLVEVSTLIPWLLQEDTHKAQCQKMLERIRERLVKDREQES